MLTQQQASTIQAQKERIQELENEAQSLNQMIQEQQRRLHTANDRIEKLSGSDLQLIESEKNIQAARQILNEAEARERSAAMAEKNAERREKELKSIISRETEHQVGQERARMKKAQSFYDRYLFMALSYGILVTWFAGALQPEFQSVCTEFASMTGSFFQTLWDSILTAGTWTAQLSTYIPHPFWAGLVHWTLLIGTATAIWSAAGWIIWSGGIRRFAPFFRRHMVNRQTAAVILTICAVCIFFAGPIHAMINPILLLLIAAAIYLAMKSLRIVRKDRAFV